MSSIKRKSLEEGLQRRVRARREPSEEIESAASKQSSAEDCPDTEGEGSAKSDNPDEDDQVSIS